MRSDDSATVTTVVDVDPATAFEVFTDMMGLHWADLLIAIGSRIRRSR